MKILIVNKYEHDHERSTVCFAQTMNSEEYKVKFVDKNYIIQVNETPVGNIDFVEHFIGKVVKPDYYPEWTKSLWHRTIFYSESKKVFLDKGLFVKPADKNKRFKGIKTKGSYSGSKKPPYIVSTLININHSLGEWRLYVENGKIIFCGWYSELEIEEQKLDIYYINEVQKLIPNNWCGTIDVGFLKTGELVLIECNNPYSCGWYGKIEQYELYVNWLIEGYKYIKKELCENHTNNKETIKYDIVENIMDEYDYNEELENYKENIKDIADYLSSLTIQ